MSTVEDFCAAVNYVRRKTGDEDLTQEAALFTWEQLQANRYTADRPLRPLMLAIAWRIKRGNRRDLVRESKATARYTAATRAHTIAEPDQEQYVLLGELARLPEGKTVLEGGGRTGVQRVATQRARQRLGELLAA